MPHGQCASLIFLLQTTKLLSSHNQALKNNNNRKIALLFCYFCKLFLSYGKSCLNPRGHLNYILSVNKRVKQKTVDAFKHKSREKNMMNSHVTISGSKRPAFGHSCSPPLPIPCCILQQILDTMSFTLQVFMGEILTYNMQISAMLLYQNWLL